MTTTTPLRELRLRPDMWNPYEMLRLARRLIDTASMQYSGDLLLIDRIDECIREEEAALSARDAAGAVDRTREWRWLDERGRAMTNWKQGEPPPMGEVSDERGTMRVEVRIATPPAASGDAEEMAGMLEALADWEHTQGATVQLTAAEFAKVARPAAALIRRLAAVAPAGMDGWRPTAHELLHRLQTARPPNVLMQQLKILGDMAALLRCMFPALPTPPAAAGKE